MVPSASASEEVVQLRMMCDKGNFDGLAACPAANLLGLLVLFLRDLPQALMPYAVRASPEIVIAKMCGSQCCHLGLCAGPLAAGGRRGALPRERYRAPAAASLRHTTRAACSVARWRLHTCFAPRPRHFATQVRLTLHCQLLLQ